jgi:hypothetical protein
MPKWYQKPGLTKAARYSFLGFAAIFELWNLGVAKTTFNKIVSKQGYIRALFTREGYDLIGALADTSAIGFQFPQTARIAAKGFNEAKALKLEKRVKRYQLANAGRMPARSAAERSTLSTLKLVTWATRVNVAASVISMFDTGLRLQPRPRHGHRSRGGSASHR